MTFARKDFEQGWGWENALKWVVFLAAVMGVSMAGCSTEEDVILNDGNHVHGDTVFYSDVKPIFDAQCAITGCHVGASPPNGLALDTYAHIMAGSSGGPVVIPGNSGASHLYLHLTGSMLPQMPPTGALEQSKIDSIKQWIDDGALE